jgi:hypothetical protein
VFATLVGKTGDYATDAVRAVAARAGRDVVVALRQLLAVHAGRVLGRLVDALARRKPSHERGIAVAAGARLDDRLSCRASLELLRRIVGPRLVGGRRIPPVAVRALEPVLPMDVAAGKQGRRCSHALILLCRMTRDARVGRGRRGLRRHPQWEEELGQEHDGENAERWLG